MGVTAQTSEEILVGAGELFINGVLAGATQDDNVFRVTREYFAPELNGIRGKLKGTDYVVEEMAEMEFTLPEISAHILSLMVPGSEMTNTAATPADPIVANTLAADAAAGAEQVTLTDATGFTVGAYLRIKTAGKHEVRKITVVAGNVLTFAVPLSFAHASGADVDVVEATGLIDRITSGPDRRLPSRSYNDFEIRVPGLDGREVRFGITDALASESPEWTATDDDNMKPRITVQARYDGAAPNTAPWYIDKHGPAGADES